MRITRDRYHCRSIAQLTTFLTDAQLRGMPAPKEPRITIGVVYPTRKCQSDNLSVTGLVLTVLLCIATVLYSKVPRHANSGRGREKRFPTSQSTFRKRTSRASQRQSMLLKDLGLPARQRY